MSKAGIELAKLQIKPNDIVVVKHKGVEYGQVVDFVMQLAQVKTAGENHIVILPPGVGVDSLDEEGMAEMGWFRKESLPQC